MGAIGKGARSIPGKRLRREVEARHVGGAAGLLEITEMRVSADDPHAPKKAVEPEVRDGADLRMAVDAGAEGEREVLPTSIKGK